ncbi:Peptidase S24 [Cyclonatronum proteinivorum]|uniref:Peptidase S24 n=1 Tax=Cyclonatronum proteinivorum TaxID=1457365 RepID=A0A345UPS7_9BACT|nr:S24 family peptidase [Cyclonatronum proteinivorum]AXJ02479.1 Peptidase S24 [Cyclonatronum proteinivorum]
MKPTVSRTVGDLVAVSEKLLKRGYHVRIKAGGQSMYPYLLNGDQLEVEPATLETLEPGDIVVFRRNQNLIAHRLHQVTGSGEHIRGLSIGDSGLSKDEMLTPDIVAGRVVARVRDGEEKPLRTPEAIRYGKRMVRLYPVPHFFAQLRLRFSQLLRRAGNLARKVSKS